MTPAAPNPHLFTIAQHQLWGQSKIPVLTDQWIFHFTTITKQKEDSHLEPLRSRSRQNVPNLSVCVKCCQTIFFFRVALISQRQLSPLQLILKWVFIWLSWTWTTKRRKPCDGSLQGINGNGTVKWFGLKTVLIPPLKTALVSPIHLWPVSYTHLTLPTNAEV